MATRAHSTRTSLLPLAGSRPSLLRQGSSRQLGPVTRAIAAMRAADPDTAPIDARHASLEALRVEDPAIEEVPQLRALRLALAQRIEADIALLDMLGGDPGQEDRGCI